jgi:predicted transcriptional regulator
MNTEPPNMLDFVKAMSDVDRLRIIGALSQGPLNASQIAATVHLPFRQAIKHLTFLSFVGVVLAHAAEKGQDEVYELA